MFALNLGLVIFQAFQLHRLIQLPFLLKELSFHSLILDELAVADCEDLCCED